MARPRKFRNVCDFPDNDRFGPLGRGAGEENIIIMPLDQYETIRLIDLEGLTQEECSDQMNIARTTVQRIYSHARKNLADSLVNGKVLKIEGGDYKLCNGQGRFCGRGNCHRGGQAKRTGKNRTFFKNSEGERKTMKISMPVNENTIKTEIADSFGRAAYFLIYNAETKETDFVENKASSSPGGAGIIAAQTLVDSQADILISPRCGQNAADVLEAADIKLYKSLEGSAEDNIKAFEDGKLEPLQEIHSGFHKHG